MKLFKGGNYMKKYSILNDFGVFCLKVMAFITMVLQRCGNDGEFLGFGTTQDELLFGNMVVYGFFFINIIQTTNITVFKNFQRFDTVYMTLFPQYNELIGSCHLFIYIPGCPSSKLYKSWLF